MKARIQAALVALVLAIAGLIGFSTPAQAAPPAAYNACGSGELCYWTGANATGTIFRFTTTQISSECTNLGSSIANQASSGYNRMGSTSVWMHDSTGCGGFSRSLAPGQWWNGPGSDWDNKWSSMHKF
jgi:hypothetical protein